MIRKSHSWSLEPSSNEIVGLSGSSIPTPRSDLRFLRRIPYGRRNLASVSLSSGERAGVRANVPCVYCSPPFVFGSESAFPQILRQSPSEVGLVAPKSQRWRIARHSTSVHERSGFVHERSLNVQPFSTPLPPGCPAFVATLIGNFVVLCGKEFATSFPVLSRSFAMFLDLPRSSTLFPHPLPLGPYENPESEML